MPATITVLNTNDTGPGSLRTAITQADMDTTQDTIDFAPGVSGTITLLSALPNLSSKIVVDGPGASVLTVARGAGVDMSVVFPIFNVTGGAEVAISGLTIAGGFNPNYGGDITNNGSMTLTDSTILGKWLNSVTNGGIFNSGSMTIINSTISGNRNFFGGGGIRNTGSMTVTSSMISGNSSSGSLGLFAIGGGILNFGSMTITGSVISDNSMIDYSGGGIGNEGSMTITGSVISGNTAGFRAGNTGRSGYGGGIDNYGTLTVASSSISGNTAVFGTGGGIENDSYGTLSVIDSTINANAADGGGGIFNDDRGKATITNSTVSGNAANSGGGILNSATMTLTSSTISGNSASSGSGIYNAPSPYYYSPPPPPPTLTLSTSILANSGGSNLDNVGAAHFNSMGYNLFSDSPAVTIQATDLVNTNPLLAPLANYGGPTFTQALLPGSPAINAGVSVPGVTTDQRGVPRPQGTAPDIGTFQSRGFTLTILSGNNQSTTVSAPFSASLGVTVTSPFGEPVAGGLVTFNTSSSEASAVLSSSTASIAANGQATVSANANSTSGSYVVTAQTKGANSVTFALTNNAIPTVLALQRFGSHNLPTSLVLVFSTPLDPNRAQDLRNYQLIAPRRHGRAIALLSARYDPTTNAVTLTPARRLSLFESYRLTVNGTAPGGLASTAGVLLDGSRSGRPGSNFVTSFGIDALAGSSNSAFNQVRIAGPALDPSAVSSSRPPGLDTTVGTG